MAYLTLGQKGVKVKRTETRAVRVILTDGTPVAPDGPKLRAGERHRARDVHLAERDGEAYVGRVKKGRGVNRVQE